MMPPYSLAPVLGGEGRGEGAIVELARWITFNPRPLTPTLSPAYRGEGAGGVLHFSSGLASTCVTGSFPVYLGCRSLSGWSRMFRNQTGAPP